MHKKTEKKYVPVEQLLDQIKFMLGLTFQKIGHIIQIFKDIIKDIWKAFSNWFSFIYSLVMHNWCSKSEFYSKKLIS